MNCVVSAQASLLGDPGSEQNEFPGDFHDG